MSVGDIAFRFIDFLRNIQSSRDTVTDSQVTVCDINQAMLDVGKNKAELRGRGQSTQYLLLSESHHHLTPANVTSKLTTLAFLSYLATPHTSD